MTQYKKCQLTEGDIIEYFLLMLCELALIISIRDMNRMFDRMLDPIHQSYLRDGSIVIP